MAPKTRSVAKANHRNYVRKSDEFVRSAQHALDRGDWDAAVSNAIHAALAPLGHGPMVLHLREAEPPCSQRESTERRPET